MRPPRVTIVGLGAMGGSLGLAIRRFLPETEIIGIDVKEKTLDLALSRGAVSRATTDLAEGVRGAQFIFLAVPIGAILKLLKTLPPILSKKTLVSDLGSTKVEICALARKTLPTQFIGGHPMTGSEIQGIAGADPYLFENAIYLLTPFASKDKNLSKLTAFLEKLGAKVVCVSPRRHDEVTALTSHLPQLAAVALAQVAGRKSARQPLVSLLAAGGFRDMTRIASSPYGLWHDILKSNSPAVKKTLSDLIKNLEDIRKQIGEKSLEAAFRQAGQFRKKLPIRRKGFMKALHRIAVSVKDEPGALARLASLLAAEAINVSDFELMRVRERFGGTFQLHFATSKEAQQAAAVLQKAGYESRQID